MNVAKDNFPSYFITNHFDSEKEKILYSKTLGERDLIKRRDFNDKDWNKQNMKVKEFCH